jgi:hypothetical protein
MILPRLKFGSCITYCDVCALIYVLPQGINTPCNFLYMLKNERHVFVFASFVLQWSNDIIIRTLRRSSKAALLQRNSHQSRNHSVDSSLSDTHCFSTRTSPPPCFKVRLQVPLRKGSIQATMILSSFLEMSQRASLTTVGKKLGRWSVGSAIVSSTLDTRP